MQNNWSTDDTAPTLVALPSGQRLSTSISGPPRTSGTPLAIIIPGVACSTTEWAAVRRLLQPIIPVLSYDRSGLGLSDEFSDEPTAVNIARELDTLLRTIELPPPYMLICHSYGGIISREFVELRQRDGRFDDVTGIVFVDANQEKSIALWPDPNNDALGKGLDWLSITGLADNHALSDSEWKAYREEHETKKHQRTTKREMEHYIPSCKVLGEKGQLARDPPLLKNYPISVLRGFPEVDLRKVLQAGIEAGNGTEDQRQQLKKKLDSYPVIHGEFQREILKLSNTYRYVEAQGCGHSIHMVRPEAIIEEVNWVLQSLQSR